MFESISGKETVPSVWLCVPRIRLWQFGEGLACRVLLPGAWIRVDGVPIVCQELWPLQSVFPLKNSPYYSKRQNSWLQTNVQETWVWCWMTWNWLHRANRSSLCWWEACTQILPTMEQALCQRYWIHQNCAKNGALSFYLFIWRTQYTQVNDFLMSYN